MWLSDRWIWKEQTERLSGYYWSIINYARNNFCIIYQMENTTHVSYVNYLSIVVEETVFVFWVLFWKDQKLLEWRVALKLYFLLVCLLIISSWLGTVEEYIQTSVLKPKDFLATEVY